MEHTLEYKNKPRYKVYAKRHEDRFGTDDMITEEEFYTLSSMSCNYCGAEGPNGIDRVDSNIGYIRSNCVPCCKHCNYVKGNLSMDLFREWAGRFVKHQISNPL